MLMYFFLDLYYALLFSKNYLFLAVLGLHCCPWAFSSHSEWRFSLVAVHGLLLVVASLVAERWFSSCGARALVAWGMWGLPWSGIKPMSPALAGRFFFFNTTEPSVQFSSVQSLSRVRLSATPWTAAHPASCPSPTPGVHPNPCPSSQWCHPTISSSVVPFSSCSQSLKTSGSFPMSQLFASGGQSIGVSASASVLPMNTKDWSPLGWTGWISLQSKGLSRVFSNTTVQEHQFFGPQLSL